MAAAKFLDIFLFARRTQWSVSGLYPEVGAFEYLQYLVQLSPEIRGAIVPLLQATLVTTITASTERNRSMVAPSKAVTSEWIGIRLSMTRPESLPEWPQPSRSNLLKRSMWESFRSKRNYTAKWYRWDMLVASRTCYLWMAGWLGSRRRNNKCRRVPLLVHLPVKTVGTVLLVLEYDKPAYTQNLPLSPSSISFVVPPSRLRV